MMQLGEGSRKMLIPCSADGPRNRVQNGAILASGYDVEDIDSVAKRHRLQD
jgi:hypothetical protein